MCKIPQLPSIDNSRIEKDFRETLKLGMLEFGMYHDDIEILADMLLRRINDKYMVIPKDS